MISTLRDSAIRQEKREGPAESPRFGTIHAGRCSTILVPIDLSRANERAITEAVARAIPRESTIWLLHIVEPVPALGGREAVIQTKPDAVVVAEAIARLERLAAPPRDLGHTVDVIVRQGRRDEMICWIASELHADLIVLGQHNPSGENDGSCEPRPSGPC